MFFLAFLNQVIMLTVTVQKMGKPIGIYTIISDAGGKRMGIPINTDQLKQCFSITGPRTGTGPRVLSAGPPNKFHHYTTIQSCAFYYNSLDYARSITFSSANRQIHAVCAANSLSFAFLAKKKNVGGEMNLSYVTTHSP